MRLRTCLSVALALSACKKTTTPEVPKVEAPADVIATLTIGHASAFATRLGRYVDAVSPGMGSQVNTRTLSDGLAKVVGAPSLDGLDLEQPVRIILLNPKTHPQHPFVLLGSFPDADKLRRGVGELAVERDNGKALVGAQAEIAAVKTWAFGPLAAADAPAAPTAEVWLDRVVATYRTEIDKLGDQMGSMPGMPSSMQSILKGEIKVLVAMADQSDRMTLTIDSTGDEASFDMALVPKSGTKLAGFVGAQKPFDQKLLAALPSDEIGAMYMLGHVELGPVGESVYQLLGPFMAQATGRTFDESFHTSWNDLLKHFTGDLAAASGMEPTGGMRMSEIVGVDDGPAAQKAMVAFYGGSAGEHKATIMEMTMIYTIAPNAAQHGSASIDTFNMKFDLANMPSIQKDMMERMYPGGLNMAMTGYGKLMAITMGKDAVERAGHLVDAANGKPSLPPYVQQVYDAAAARKDSMVMVMNMAAFMNPTLPASPAQSGFAITMSFADKSAHMRMSLPAKHIAEITAAVRSSPQFQH